MEAFFSYFKFTFLILPFLITYLGLKSIWKGWNRILVVKEGKWINKNGLYVGAVFVLLGILLLWIAIPVFMGLPHLFALRN